MLCSVSLPCDYRWESAYSGIHAQYQVCTCRVHLSPLSSSAVYCIHDEDFLPLLFKLNHKVTYSNKLEVSFQNINSINVVLASMLLFFKNIKVRFAYFYRYTLVDLSYKYKGKPRLMILHLRTVSLYLLCK